MPNPLEIATIVAAGQTYTYWQSIEIERMVGTGVSYMTFTCAEPGPLTDGFSALKLGIGIQAQGYLAGRLAITGVTDTREAAYDAKNHAVKIRVASRTQELTASTVDASPGQYRNYTFMQMAQAVASKVGVNVTLDGNPSGADKIFERVSEHVGELRFDFLERLARWRNLHLVDDEHGNLIFFRAGSGSAGGAVAQLVEGQNILAAHIMMRNDFAVAQISVKTARHGNNDHWDDDARNISATAQNPNYSGPRSIVIAGEQPEDTEGAQMRANHEMNTNDLQMCEATITVPGWLLDDGTLWIEHLREPVILRSPMLMPSGSDLVQLFVKGARHLQDNSGGTRTDVILCLESGLGGPQVQIQDALGAA